MYKPSVMITFKLVTIKYVTCSHKIGKGRSLVVSKSPICKILPLKWRQLYQKSLQEVKNLLLYNYDRLNMAQNKCNSQP